MSDAFDPYYIWLGIPPEDQPPHHYRLLGVTLFESNREVIEAAANRQMAYMQEISAGDEHIDQAQKILGELSRARICLLNAEKKEAYDAKLRASFDSLAPAPPATPPEAADEAEQSAAAPAVGLPQQPHAATAKKQSLVPIIGLVIVTLVVIVGGVTFFLSSQAEKREAQRAADLEKKEQQAEVERQAQAKVKQKAKEAAAKEETERIAREKKEREAKKEEDRIAREKKEREAKKEEDRIAREKKEREAKKEEDRIAREKKEREAKKEEGRIAKEEAAELLTSRGFVRINSEWWPDASYEVAEKEAKSLQGNDLYNKDRKEFWRQVGDLLDKRKQIQVDLDAANNDPEIISRLAVLNQQIGTLPEILWLNDTATNFLEQEGLEKTEKNIWRLKEEAKLKEATDAESNLSSEMLKNFNLAQQQLLTKALQVYRKKTKAEWEKLLKVGEQTAGQQGKVGFNTNGKNEYGEVGWTRFTFLTWHHPDVNLGGWPKRSPDDYHNHALSFCTKKLGKNSAWKKASKKTSTANMLRKKISKRYKKLKRDTEAAVALQVVGGHLPSKTEKNN